MAFEIGAAVQLKGGSPIMTVTAHGKDAQGKPRVTCTWFDSAGKEQNGTYPPEALKAYTGEKGSEGENDDGDWMTR